MKKTFLSIATVTMMAVFSISLIAVSCKTPPSQETGSVTKTITVPSTWRVVSLLKNGNISRIAVKPGVKNPVITFNAEGALAGNTGVNRFFGKYTVSKNGITMTPAGSSLMLGINDEANENERAFLEAIAKVADFTISPRRLTLYDAQKKLLMLCELGDE
ncbi:MAG: hypothetical protein Ta2A_01520 [Treponemataceae bacterium]|nr:MAG: hypothetical protein Ta2A_01520 [Treponemataceae bacterium]